MTRSLTLALLATSALVPTAGFAQTATELPSGGTVVGGQARIGTPQGNTLRIDQGSDRAIINWQSFSVGQGGRVNIVQPDANAALLNRVTGSATSEIAGQLNANGRVFLVNPNGILITKSGSVNAAGFTASTLDIADDAFMAGDDTVTVTAPRGRAVVGRVAGGYAGLLGGRLDDRGLIRATLHTDAAGAGALDLGGDGFLQVGLPAAGITVAGTINAHEVVLRAGTAREAARQTVNLSGTIRATGVDSVGGIVVLTGDSVNLTGATVDASGARGGGSVTVGGGAQGGGSLAHAAQLTVDAASTIRADATGSGNGGLVVLWSDAATRFAGTIGATGAGGGNGGDAEVSGANLLDYAGTADLRGATWGTLLLDPYNVTISTGANSNQAGFAATGNDSVINTTTLQNALATANVTVSTGTAGAQAGNITVASPLTWASGSLLTLTAANAIAINAAVSINGAGQLALNTATNVAGNTTQPLLSFGTGGSVNYAAGSGGTGITGQALSINGRAYSLIYSQEQLNGIDPGSGGNGTSATPYGVGLTGDYALARDLNLFGTTYAAAPIAGNLGTGSLASIFSGTLEGLGHTLSNLTVNYTSNSFRDVGLIGDLTGTIRNNNVSGSITNASSGQTGGLVGYALGGAVIASSSSANTTGSGLTGGLIGAATSGTIVSGDRASGTVRGTNAAGGLIGQSGAVVTNSFATGNVGVGGGGFDIGGLIGWQSGGSTTGSYATGAVAGNGNVGGLIGRNSTSVSNSYAIGMVTGTQYVGGLVGFGSGDVSNSYATGAVTGTSEVGGLIGQSSYRLAYDAGTMTNVAFQSAITQSYATGPVRGTTNVGGLVGQSSSFVSDSYAAGAVTATGNGADNVGGLVGRNAAEQYDPNRPALAGLVTRSHATGNVDGTGSRAGGLVGVNDSGAGIGIAYATGAVAGTGNVGGLVGQNSGNVADTYATGSASGSGDANSVGGLVGNNLAGTIATSYSTGVASSSASFIRAVGGFAGENRATITRSYFDTTTSGTATGVGTVLGSTDVTGRTTAHLASALPAGFSPAVWGNANNQTTPYLNAQPGPVYLAAGGPLYTVILTIPQLQAINANLAGNYALGQNIDAAGTTYTGALVAAGGTAFSGTFDGLGNTISNLTIATIGNGNIGLFGTSSGTIRNVGLVGGTVTGGGGGDQVGVGALVGTNNGAISRSFATTQVIGGSAPLDFVGGLVGFNGNALGSAATITLSYATGTVSGGRDSGGLAGDNNGTITQSYATGAVSSDRGEGVAGGLAGGNNGVIRQSYATGPTSGGGFANGGLVGVNRNLIDQSYATGATTGGGLSGFASGTGNNNNTITNSYWDTQTTGQASSVGGGAGLTTAQFQAGALPAGFDPAAWGIGTGLYPYLKGFYPTGVQAISGTAFSAAGTAAAIAQVGVYVGGTLAGRAVTYSGANGYYYAIVPAGTFAASGNTLGQTITLNGATAISGLTYSDAVPRDANGNLSNQAITSGRRSYITAAPTLSALNAALATTFGSATYAAFPATLAATSEGIISTNAGGFSVDVAQSLGGTSDFALNAAGDLTLAAPLSAFTTSLASGGGIAQTAGAVITTRQLTGSSVRGAALTAANQIDTVTQFVTNNAPLSLANAKALEVSGIIRTDAGSIALTTTGGLSVSGSLVSNATVTLNSAGDIQERGSIIAGTLTGSATGSASLNGPNMIAAIRNFSTANGLIALTNRAPTTTIDNVSSGSAFVLTTDGEIFLAGSLRGGDVALSTNGGGITQTGGTLTSQRLTADAFNAISLTLANALTNAVRLQAGGAIALNDAGSLTVGTVRAGNGTDITIRAGQDLTLATDAALTGRTISLAATRNFVNQAGANVLNASNRWLVYAADPRTSSPGGLAPAFIQYAAPFGTAPAQATGNGFLYSLAPVITVGLTGMIAKTYDGTTAATLVAGNYTVSGAVGGDMVATTTPTTGTYDTANAGTGKTVTSSSVAITSARNGTAVVYGYQLAAPAASGAVGTISPATLTYTATPASRPYGSANPAFTGTVTGFVAGQTQASATTGTLAFTSPAISGSNVGAYAITGTGLAANNGNYVFQQAAGNASALTITPYLLTVGGQRAYDGTTAFATRDLLVGAGVNGEQVTLTGGTGTAASANVGSYANSPLSGLAVAVSGGNASAANYALPTTGTLTIGQRAVTVTADALSRAYGDANPALTYTATNLLAGMTLNGALATTATPASGVGGYAITQGSVTDANNPNYAVAYVGNTLSVTPRPLTVSADALSRIYGDANPALTYTVGGRGLVNGDTLSGALATAADQRSGVGRYAIAQGSLAASANYDLSYVGNLLTVTPRALVVTPDAVSRVYGNANPARGSASAATLVNGDTVTSVALSSPATAASAVGGYALSASDAQGSGLSNYTISYAGRANGLTVTPRAISVTADALGRVYGDANSMLTYRVGGLGLVNGDTLSGVLVTSATAASGIGGYAIGQGSLAASANYQLSYTGNLLTVTPRPLTITADPQNRLAGQPNAPLTYTLGGRGLVNGDLLSGGLATLATQASGPGAYPITQGSLAASANYVVTYVGGLLTVGRPLGLAGGLLAGTQQRDGFAADTLPLSGGAVVDETDGTPGGVVTEPTAGTLDRCPRDQPCKLER